MVTKKKSTSILESYGKWEENDRSFDVQFWQSQGSEAIFGAAYEMIKDYLLLKNKNADDSQFQRSVALFGKKQL